MKALFRKLVGQQDNKDIEMQTGSNYGSIREGDLAEQPFEQTPSEINFMALDHIELPEFPETKEREKKEETDVPIDPDLLRGNRQAYKKALDQLDATIDTQQQDREKEKTEKLTAKQQESCGKKVKNWYSLYGFAAGAAKLGAASAAFLAYAIYDALTSSNLPPPEDPRGGCSVAVSNTNAFLQAEMNYTHVNLTLVLTGVGLGGIALGFLLTDIVHRYYYQLPNKRKVAMRRGQIEQLQRQVYDLQTAFALAPVCRLEQEIKTSRQIADAIKRILKGSKEKLPDVPTDSGRLCGNVAEYLGVLELTHSVIEEQTKEDEDEEEKKVTEKEQETRGKQAKNWCSVYGLRTGGAVSTGTMLVLVITALVKTSHYNPKDAFGGGSVAISDINSVLQDEQNYTHSDFPLIMIGVATGSTAFSCILYALHHKYGYQIQNQRDKQEMWTSLERLQQQIYILQQAEKLYPVCGELTVRLPSSPSIRSVIPASSSKTRGSESGIDFSALDAVLEEDEGSFEHKEETTRESLTDDGLEYGSRSDYLGSEDQKGARGQINITIDEQKKAREEKAAKVLTAKHQEGCGKKTKNWCGTYGLVVAGVKFGVGTAVFLTYAISDALTYSAALLDSRGDCNTAAGRTNDIIETEQGYTHSDISWMLAGVGLGSAAMSCLLSTIYLKYFYQIPEQHEAVKMDEDIEQLQRQVYDLQKARAVAPVCRPKHGGLSESRLSTFGSSPKRFTDQSSVSVSSRSAIFSQSLH